MHVVYAYKLQRRLSKLVAEDFLVGLTEIYSVRWLLQPDTSIHHNGKQLRSNWVTSQWTRVWSLTFLDQLWKVEPRPLLPGANISMTSLTSQCSCNRRQNRGQGGRRPCHIFHHVTRHQIHTHREWPFQTHVNQVKYGVEAPSAGPIRMPSWWRSLQTL